MTKLIVNCETGETVERELNKAEKDQQKADEALVAQYAEARAQQAAQKAALLARLGLTEDELKTILG
jgi:hypothetical protein